VGAVAERGPGLRLLRGGGRGPYVRGNQRGHAPPGGLRSTRRQLRPRHRAQEVVENLNNVDELADAWRGYPRSGCPSGRCSGRTANGPRPPGARPLRVARHAPAAQAPPRPPDRRGLRRLRKGPEELCRDLRDPHPEREVRPRRRRRRRGPRRHYDQGQTRAGGAATKAASRSTTSIPSPTRRRIPRRRRRLGPDLRSPQPEPLAGNPGDLYERYEADVQTWWTAYKDKKRSDAAEKGLATKERNKRKLQEDLVDNAQH